MAVVRPTRALVLGAALSALSGLVVLGAGSDGDATAQPQPVEVLGATETRAVDAPVATATVVRVVASGCSGWSVGSGVLLDGRRVLTARHVLDGASSATVEVPGAGAVRATVAGLDRGGRDAAVLDLASPVAAAPAVLRHGDLPRSGSAVAALGHPAGGTLVRRDGTVVGSQARGPLALDGGRVLTMDLSVDAGMSGGPVVDGSGRLVGVAIGFDRSTRTGIAVPVGEITALLRDDGDAPTPSCPPR